jgi:hypothetical protein
MKKTTITSFSIKLFTLKNLKSAQTVLNLNSLSSAAAIAHEENQERSTHT